MYVTFVDMLAYQPRQTLVKIVPSSLVCELRHSPKIVSAGTRGVLTSLYPIAGRPEIGSWLPVVWWSGGPIPYDFVMKWWSGGLVVWWSGGLFQTEI